MPQAKSFAACDISLADGLPLTEETGLSVTAIDACDKIRNTASTVEHCDSVINHPDSPGVRWTREFFSMDVCGHVSTRTSQTIDVLDSCSTLNGLAFSGPNFQTEVTLLNQVSDGENRIQITAENTDSYYLGDLRGVFFNCNVDLLPSQVDKIHIDIKELVGNDGNSITPPSSTNFKCDSNGIDVLTNDVLMRGGGMTSPRLYTCAVEVGTRGISKDDIKKVVFDVYIPGTDLTTNNCASDSDIGFRITSVGSVESGRGNSSKTNGKLACCRNIASSFQNTCI